jgi:hypothetical protein
VSSGLRLSLILPCFLLSGFAALGFPSAALTSLSDALRAGRRRPEVAREALAVLGQVPPGNGLDAQRTRLRERLLAALQ